MLHNGEVSLIINTPTHGRVKSRDGFKLRRIAVEAGVTCITSLDAARSLMESATTVENDTVTLTNIAEL